MNNEQIQTFLKIYETGSIAGASRELFIEQGTVSRRIQQLEDELGIVLITREKGKRNTMLSEEGKQFLPIAQQMSALYDDSCNLKKYQSRRFCITATNTITSEFLAPCFAEFMRLYPDIELITKVEHATEMYREIDTQIVDVGFTASLHAYPNVYAEPVYSEKFLLIYHEDSEFKAKKNIFSLRPEHEVYMRYSSVYETWHRERFDDSWRKKISVGNLQSLSYFLTEKEDWCILPETAAEKWVNNHHGWRTYLLQHQPPQRVIYALSHRYPLPGVKEEKKKLLEIFRKKYPFKGIVD